MPLQHLLAGGSSRLAARDAGLQVAQGRGLRNSWSGWLDPGTVHVLLAWLGLAWLGLAWLGLA